MHATAAPGVWTCPNWLRKTAGPMNPICSTMTGAGERLASYINVIDMCWRQEGLQKQMQENHLVERPCIQAAESSV